MLRPVTGQKGDACVAPTQRNMVDTPLVLNARVEVGIGVVGGQVGEDKH